MFCLMQDAFLQQNGFILSSCVLCQFSCPTSQHQRTTPVMGQAASRIVLTSSKHYFPAAGRLDVSSVAELILLCWCIWTTFSIYLRNLLSPGAQSCLLLSGQNLFYLSGFPRANASFLQEKYTVLISANQMVFSFHLSQEFSVPNMLFAGSICQDFKLS